MSDTPETDLEDDLYIECASSYIIKESTGAIFTGDFVPAEFARRLERERDDALREAKKWKSNHDNQVELKSIISKRGDLKDRAPRVEKLIAERNQLREALERAGEIWANLASEQNTEEVRNLITYLMPDGDPK